MNNFTRKTTKPDQKPNQKPIRKPSSQKHREEEDDDNDTEEIHMDNESFDDFVPGSPIYSSRISLTPTVNNATKIRNYLKLFMKDSTNLYNAPKYNNLIYVRIPNSVTDYKHGNMFDKIKTEIISCFEKVNKTDDNDNGDKKLNDLMKVLEKYKTIKSAIGSNIINIYNSIKNSLFDFIKKSFDGDGLFYLADSNEELNTNIIMVSNIIITLQKRIIIREGKSAAFDVDKFYGNPGKKVQKTYTVGLKDSIDDFSALGKTRRDKKTNSSIVKSPNAFNLHSFILLNISLNDLKNYRFFEGKNNAVAIAHMINAKVIPNCIGNIWVYVRDWPEEKGRSGKFNIGKQNITWTGGKYHPDPLKDDTTKYLIINI
ncbi:hypothetical protein EDI_114340 [Entamoeba dispar SAW760]|uniref:Uncharacterized protein n=1 Tax=Entamoeba dispar (strain ATCC PRA-260 / SAW760) TaxID=370354 RepID=B0ELV2_ENTDS|nr:uncharacterized protein EDI_114340 [Entamoeba dispar SAW760]EDR24495.1 hypothetical protein EDI_114340 [Entamoeba dispar SAW760]|eukprot:EDR24495.1 hypothetical protein EDI_114340 [Entamoeba dispar SAW760]